MTRRSEVGNWQTDSGTPSWETTWEIRREEHDPEDDVHDPSDERTWGE